MGRTKVLVVPHQGRTAISVNGKVIPGMSYFTYMLHGGNMRRDVLHEMVSCGIKIFLVLWQSWRPKFHAEPWSSDGKIDFTPIDEWMSALSGMADDIWFVPRLFFSTPHWWADRYPEELVRFSDEDLTLQQKDGQDVLNLASMASTRWRKDVSKVLESIVTHIENGPYSDRVLGYMINSGGTEEWVYHGSQQGRIPDYSLPALKSFHKWLRNKYGSDVSLAEAWSNPGITIDRAKIPSESERRRCAPSVAKNPLLDRPSIDYELFLSELCADNLLEWCRVVKNVTGRRKLTGSFYGYLLWQSGYANGVVNNGHLALRKLLDSPEIDFITGITSYDNRGTGEPGSFMLPVESLQSAGKLAFNEVDIRTHLSTGRPSEKEIEPTFRNNYAYNLQESISIYRREFAHHLVSGAAWWDFDMSGGWYSQRELLDEFSAQAKIAGRAINWDMSSVSESAVFVSSTSPAFQRFFTMQEVMADLAWLNLQCDRATTELYYTGVPFDWWMTDDLKRPEISRYKLLYIFNAMYMSNEERKWLERLKGEGRTIVFCGCAGMIDDKSVSAENASSLTGINLRLNETRQPLWIDVDDYKHPILKECESTVTLGTGALVTPCLEVDDSDSIVLGRWRKTGAPAFAVKEYKAWRSIVCPAPINHRLVARGIMKKAGCHVWIEPGRILFVNRSILAVHIADSHEPMRIHLPEPMDVFDLTDGHTVAEDARHFLIQRDIREHTTFLYHLQRKKKNKI